MSFVKSAQFLKKKIIIFVIFWSNKEGHFRFCQRLQSKNLNTAVNEFELASNSIHFSQVLHETRLNHYLQTIKVSIKFTNKP